MYIVIFCSLVALLFTYLETKGLFKKGMLWGFILVTFLQIVKYDYGNDYIGYYQAYLKMIENDFNWQEIKDGVLHKDVGWALILYLFKPLGEYGFFVMEGIISILQGVVMYKFIRKYVPRSGWSFSVLIYLFSASFYLMSFSMLRQSLVMTIFFAMWSLIEQRKFIIPLIVLYLCSFIHASSIILFPFAFWGFIPMGKYSSKFFTTAFLALFVCLFVYSNILHDIFLYAVDTSEKINEYYNNYKDGANITIGGIGFFLNFIPLYVSLKYIASSDNNKSSKLLVALCSIGYIILPFGQIIQLIGRIGMYFSIFSILSLPIAYGQIKNSIIRAGLTSIFLLILIYNYITFFRNPTFIEKFGGEFSTIFSVM